ncbi:MAG: tetratricopeptide repeat protein [Myxococcota bacterium]|nr:tetratricopeptide repeat protein [Myxococcota bacterium]
MILWALEKDVDDRLPSALEFKRQLLSVLEVTPPMISESPKALSVEALVLDAVDKVSVDAPVTKQRLSVLVVDAGCNLKAIDDATEERKIDSFIAALVKKYGGQHKRIAPARFAIVMEMRDKLGNDPRLGLAFASRIISEFEHVSIGMHHDWVQLSGNTFVGGIAIDIAERIALNCPAQGFLLTEPIRAFSKGVSLRVSAVFQHKGMSAPIQMYECENLDDLKTLGIDSDETKRETNDLSLVDVGWPFIGRHRYQDIIKSLNETQEGGRVCWLVGSPGVGKSRVLVEIVKADPSRQWMFLNARNNGVIRAFIEQIGADIFGADVRGFVRWLGGGKLPKEYLNSTPEELISASSGVLARAVLTKSAMEPVGLIVDDYDLAPTQLRKILREVIDLGRKNEITVILSSRNDASILEGERRVQLLPLKLNESHELISLLSGTADIPKNILQKTGGNPGIAVSLARLVRSGVEINKLQGSPDSNIARLLSDAWLENLGGPIREAILALGILGDEFSTSVGQTFVRDAFKNKVSWDELTHTGMLEFSPDGQSVRVSLFELGSLTEHYLESSNRCTYHRIAAGIFERLEDLPEVAAEHLTLAGDQERAIQVLRHGAHDLAQSGEGFRALECFRRLISEDFSPLKSQDSYIEDLLSCSRSCREVGDLRLAKDLSNRLDKVADEARGTRLGLGVSTERIQLWTIQGKTKEVRGGLLEVMKHAEREKDYGALACLMGVAADLNEKEGQLEKSVEFSKKAVSLAGRIGNAASQALAIGELGRIGRVLFKSNQHATAMGAFQNQIAIAEKTGNYKEIARARVNIGVVLQHTKKYTEALSAMEKGFSAAMRAGDFLTAAKASHNMGNVFVFQGQLKEAQSYFEKSLGLSEQMQWSQGVAINHAHLKKLASKAKDAGLGHSPLSK